MQLCNFCTRQGNSGQRVMKTTSTCKLLSSRLMYAGNQTNRVLSLVDMKPRSISRRFHFRHQLLYSGLHLRLTPASVYSRSIVNCAVGRVFQCHFPLVLMASRAPQAIFGLDFPKLHGLIKALRQQHIIDQTTLQVMVESVTQLSILASFWSIPGMGPDLDKLFSVFPKLAGLKI